MAARCSKCLRQAARVRAMSTALSSGCASRWAAKRRAFSRRAAWLRPDKSSGTDDQTPPPSRSPQDHVPSGRRIRHRTGRRPDPRACAGRADPGSLQRAHGSPCSCWREASPRYPRRGHGMRPDLHDAHALTRKGRSSRDNRHRPLHVLGPVGRP
jgi:hypothetical protein